MRQLVFIALLMILAGAGQQALAQDKEMAAFSASYENEYHQDYLAAIESMEAAYDANNYEMNLRLGWLCYLATQHDKSIKYYNKAISLSPNSIEAKLGYVYPASALGNWSDVITQYKNILKLDATNSIVNYRLAYILFNQGESAAALPYAKKVISMYPFDFDTNYLLGRIYADMGKKDEARKHLKMALKYNPSSIVVNRELNDLGDD